MLCWVFWLAWLEALFALRLKKMSPRVIWTKGIFRETIGTILHTFDLERSLKELLHILKCNQYPFWAVYDSNCSIFVGTARYKEIESIAIKDPSLWSILASPDCLAAIPTCSPVHSCIGTENHPSSCFLSRYIDPSRFFRPIQRLQIEKIIGLPVTQIDSCSWIKHGFEGINLDDPVIIKAVWDRLHLRCLEEVMLDLDLPKYYTFFQIFASVVELYADNDFNLLQLFIKMANLVFLTERYGGAGPVHCQFATFSETAELILKRMAAKIERIDAPWALEVLLLYNCISDGANGRVVICNAIVQQIALDIKGSMEWQLHWYLQLAELSVNIFGGVSTLIRLSILQAVEPESIWPLDILTMLRVELGTKGPSRVLCALVAKFDPTGRPTVVQTHVMDQCSARIDVKHDFYLELLRHVPLSVRLSTVRRAHGMHLLQSQGEAMKNRTRLIKEFMSAFRSCNSIPKILGKMTHILMSKGVVSVTTDSFVARFNHGYSGDLKMMAMMLSLCLQFGVSPSISFDSSQLAIIMGFMPHQENLLYLGRNCSDENLNAANFVEICWAQRSFQAAFREYFPAISLFAFDEIRQILQ